MRWFNTRRWCSGFEEPAGWQGGASWSKQELKLNRISIEPILSHVLPLVVFEWAKKQNRSKVKIGH